MPEHLKHCTAPPRLLITKLKQRNSKMAALSRAHLIRLRIISLLAIAAIAFGGFESLLYINHLNQPAVYLKLSGYIYFIYFFWTHFIFDLHFKGSFVDVKGI